MTKFYFAFHSIFVDFFCPSVCSFRQSVHLPPILLFGRFAVQSALRSDGQHFSSTCLATLLYCKINASVARITTFVTNLLKKNVARITGPLGSFIHSSVYPSVHYSQVCSFVSFLPMFVGWILHSLVCSIVNLLDRSFAIRYHAFIL